MADDKVFHLLNVLKDVNEHEVVQKLNKIQENNDSHISHLFLEDYFRSKDAYVPPEIYRDEAQCIVNIFPQYSVEYVKSMLETLGNEDNRVIVILRQLLKNEPIKSRQLLNSEPIKNVLNKCTSTKSQTLPDSIRDSNIVNLVSQPCTSLGIIHPNYFAPQRNTSAVCSKPETTIPKRKIPDPPIGLKLKIKRVGSIYVQENAEHNMPVTSSHCPSLTKTPKLVMSHILESKPDTYPLMTYEDNRPANMKLPSKTPPMNITHRPVWPRDILCPQENYNTTKVNTDPNVESAKLETPPPSVEDLVATFPESNDYPQRRMSSVESWLNDILPLTNTKKESTAEQHQNVNSSNDIPPLRQNIENVPEPIPTAHNFVLPVLENVETELGTDLKQHSNSLIDMLPPHHNTKPPAPPPVQKQILNRFTNSAPPAPIPQIITNRTTERNLHMHGFYNFPVLPKNTKNEQPAAARNQNTNIFDDMFQREIEDLTRGTVRAPATNWLAPPQDIVPTAVNKVERRDPLPGNFMQNVEPPPTADQKSKSKMNKDIEYPWMLLHRPRDHKYDHRDNDENGDDTDVEDEDMMEISSDNEEDDFVYNFEKPNFTANGVSNSADEKLVSKIMEIFPDASPAYIREVCVGKKSTASDIDDVVQLLLTNENYPKRVKKEPSPVPDLDLEEQVALLKDILPDADPNYLQYHAELYLQDKDKLKEFMSNALELKNYPTLKDHTRKQQISAQVKQYTTEFHVEKFLEIIPDPDTYFNDPNTKKSIYDRYRTDVLCLHYLTRFLKNHYANIAIRTIASVMTRHDHHLTAIVQELDSYVDSGKYLIKSRRKVVPVDSTIQNIPLLQEIAYITHRLEIKHYLDERETKEKQEKQLAKQNGLLNTCNCCYDDEVMPRNIVKCQNGCDFCKNCVKTSVEILFGEGKLEYPCLQNCGSFFSLQTLKNVLLPKLFSKMAQKKQLEEVKAAGIDELEMCPFCDFATIPAPGDKLFKCLNPDCMKESCRECKEPSHIPLRCDEIEKDDDVKNRLYIENKMTEALIRICYKCGMKFIKADGCNKMTCSCGAKMCYVCGQAVDDYKHFNGQGGDKHHLCPLYSDTNKLHQDAVIKGAEQAKVEIGVAGDPRKLKIDPAADLQQHYNVKPKVHKVPHVAMEPFEQDLRLLMAYNHRQRLAVQQRRRHRHYHHHHHYQDRHNPNGA